MQVNIYYVINVIFRSELSHIFFVYCIYCIFCILVILNDD